MKSLNQQLRLTRVAHKPEACRGQRRRTQSCPVVGDVEQSAACQIIRLNNLPLSHWCWAKPEISLKASQTSHNVLNPQIHTGFEKG